MEWYLVKHKETTVTNNNTETLQTFWGGSNIFLTQYIEVGRRQYRLRLESINESQDSIFVFISQ